MNTNFETEVLEAPAQGTEDWLAWRKQGITATEAASIMFPDRYSSPLKVYSEKLGITESDQSDPDGFMEWGHKIEDLLVSKFMSCHPDFTNCTQGRLYQRDWCKCSLDAQCYDAGGEACIIECKTGQSSSKWAPYPDKYYAQLQWQMYVTGIRKGYFAVLICGHDYFEREVEYNQAFVDKMLEKCKVVWDCILNKTPPAELGFFSADKEAIEAMAGLTGHTGKPEEIEPDLAEKYIKLKEAADRANAELDSVKNEIAFKMVDVSTLTLNGKAFSSWVERKGSMTIDKDKLKSKYPDAYNACSKTGAGCRYVRCST